ncbi:hypothetical protein H9P43_003373 [Blastocladiella emersonii ATCC 22665]|nr:hypothetical protein H9P43_003373 [Blastocladiella emersonii ATCC 22665]
MRVDKLPLITLVSLCAVVTVVQAQQWWSSDIQLANVGMVHPSADGSANAGRCVDFDRGSATGTYARASMWACHGPADSDAAGTQLINRGAVIGDNNYRLLHNHQGVDYCLDVENGNAYAGASVRWWACNNADAQRWYVDPRDKSMAWRSKLNHNLCLDPAGGWNGDKNGQPLMLWHCHGGVEQKFSGEPLYSFKTNGLWDMERGCVAQSTNKYVCGYYCPSASTTNWIGVFFEGVKFACGLGKWGPGLVCVTAVAGLQGVLAQDNACSCRCLLRTDPCGPLGKNCFAATPGKGGAGAAQNQTLEALIASHKDDKNLEEFVAIHADLKQPATFVPIASVVKQNPSLATILAAHSSANAAKPTMTVGPVLTKTHVVTKPTVTATTA